jgi:hypothetical protein
LTGFCSFTLTGFGGFSTFGGLGGFGILTGFGAATCFFRAIGFSSFGAISISLPGRSLLFHFRDRHLADAH